MKITIKRKISSRKKLDILFGASIAVIGILERRLIQHKKETNDMLVKLNSKLIELDTDNKPTEKDK